MLSHFTRQTLNETPGEILCLGRERERESEQLDRLVVLCSQRDQPERRVSAPGSAICCLFDRQHRHLEAQRERERSVKATAALQGHALCRKLSLFLSLSPPLCPLLCGKNRSTDLSVQLFYASHFHLDLTRCSGCRLPPRISSPPECLCICVRV